MTDARDALPGNELEQSVLGALLQDNRSLAAAQPLSPAHFTDPMHAAVFHAIVEMAPGADFISVHERLGAAGPGLAYMTQLEQCVPSAANVGKYAELLRARAAKRDALATLERLRLDLTIASDTAAAIAHAREVLGSMQADSAPAYFARVDLARLGSPQPPQQWAWQGYAPSGQVTLLSGHGGTGKSTLGLMLAACIAVGRDCLGRQTRPARVCYFSGEDPAPLVLARLERICRVLDIDPAAMRERLHVLDAADADPVLFSASGTTPTYDALAAFVESHGVEVLIADNASDCFDGDEINRAMVRAFVRSLAKLVRPRNGAALLLGHVNRGTASKGNRPDDAEGYSGSTAWNNSVRSRLFLFERGPGEFELRHQKCNVGPKQSPLMLEWPTDGVFEVAATGGMVKVIAERGHAKALLRLIHEFTQRGESVGTATTSRTHAGKLLRTEPGFPQRLPDAELFDLLRQAERRGWIERETYQGADRHRRERWRVTPAGLAEVGIAATAATAATTEVNAPGAVPAEPAATAATSPPGGMGETAPHEVPAEPGLEVLV